MDLSTEDIRFSYGRFSPPVFTSLTVKVPPGCTVLLGPNGAGKAH